MVKKQEKVILQSRTKTPVVIDNEIVEKLKRYNQNEIDRANNVISQQTQSLIQEQLETNKQQTICLARHEL